MKSNKQSRPVSSIIATVATVLVVGATFLTIFFYRDIQDTVRALMYTPSAQVASVQERTGMTGAGARIFKATGPQIVDAEQFNSSCPRQEASNPIVGCYTPDDAIFVYDITNEELDGIKDVTAVHELLHAVWQRMSLAEREQIGAQLEEVYSKQSKDGLKERMEYYYRQQSGQEVNELHSVVGTEVADLPLALENHYKKYFNRAAVLALYQGYSDHYKELSATSQRLKDEADALADRIESESTAYSRDARQVETEINQFNSRAENGGFTSRGTFLSERRALVVKVDALEVRRTTLNQLIEKHAALEVQYREIAQEIQALNKSIDSFQEVQQPAGIEAI